MFRSTGSSGRHACLVFSYLLLCTEGKTFRVAWLTPLTDEQYFINAETTVAALKMALHSVTKNTIILRNHTLGVKVFGTDCRSQSAMAEAMFARNSYDPDVIIGPPCREAMSVVGGLATYWNLPVLSWFNRDQDFDGTDAFPTMIRMLPPAKEMVEVLSGLFQLTGWKKCTFLYDPRPAWRTLEESIRGRASSSRINILSSHVISDDMLDTQVQEVFRQVRLYSRVIVMAVPWLSMRRYMLIAAGLGMDSGQFAFVCLDSEIHKEEALTKDVLSNGGWYRNDVNDVNARKIFESVIHVIMDPMNHDVTDPYTTPRNRYKEFAELATGRQIQDRPEWELPVGLQPDVYSLFLYDAVLAWSVLVDLLYKSGQNFRDGLLMAENARHFYAEGATGYIALDADLDRVGKYFILDMDESGSFVPVQTVKFDRRGNAAIETYSGSNAARDLFRWGDGQSGTDNAPSDEPPGTFDACPELSDKHRPDFGSGRGIPISTSSSEIISQLWQRPIFPSSPKMSPFITTQINTETQTRPKPTIEQSSTQVRSTGSTTNPPTATRSTTAARATTISATAAPPTATRPSTARTTTTLAPATHVISTTKSQPAPVPTVPDKQPSRVDPPRKLRTHGDKVEIKPADGVASNMTVSRGTATDRVSSTDTVHKPRDGSTAQWPRGRPRQNPNDRRGGPNRSKVARRNRGLINRDPNRKGPTTHGAGRGGRRASRQQPRQAPPGGKRSQSINHNPPRPEPINVDGNASIKPRHETQSLIQTAGRASSAQQQRERQPIQRRSRPQRPKPPPITLPQQPDSSHNAIHHHSSSGQRPPNELSQQSQMPHNQRLRSQQSSSFASDQFLPAQSSSNAGSQSSPPVSFQRPSSAQRSHVRSSGQAPAAGVWVQEALETTTAVWQAGPATPANPDPWSASNIQISTRPPWWDLWLQ